MRRKVNNGFEPGMGTHSKLAEDLFKDEVLFISFQPAKTKNSSLKKNNL